MAILKRALLILLLLPSPIVWAASPHAYFDWLSQQSETMVANSYRTQAQINRDTAPNWRPNAWINYDSNQDAAQITLNQNQSGLSGTGQLRPGFDNNGYANSPQLAISTGNLLLTWDAKWGQSFVNVTSQGLSTEKAFQLSRIGSGDDRRLEIRTRFSHSGSSDVAKVDMRSYQFGHDGDHQPMGRNGCNGHCQINEFDIQADTWTRFWSYVDFDNNTFSLWMADENNSPVKLFDQMAMNYTTSLNAFWFEYNSSQKRTGPELHAWLRNLVILHNVSDVNAMVAQGANVGAGLSNPSPPNSDTIPPSAPTNLVAQ